MALLIYPSAFRPRDKMTIEENLKELDQRKMQLKHDKEDLAGEKKQLQDTRFRRKELQAQMDQAKLQEAAEIKKSDESGDAEAMLEFLSTRIAELEVEKRQLEEKINAKRIRLDQEQCEINTATRWLGEKLDSRKMQLMRDMEELGQAKMELQDVHFRRTGLQSQMDQVKLQEAAGQK